jgi:ABC-type glycerol-3-phosphate transport system substrate-binding protein
VQPDALRGQMIHFWHPWSGAQEQLLRPQVDDFNLSNEWGILVVPVFKGSLDQLDAALLGSTGDLPDVAIGYLHQVATWEQQIAVLDLEPFVQDSLWGLSADEQAAFYPVFWEQDLLKGKRLGLPAVRSAQVLYYNKTWAQELGFQMAPKTPEEFAEQACAAARANRQDAPLENDGTGGWIIAASHSAMLSWIYSFGGEPFKGENYKFQSAGVEEAFTFLRGLLDQGCAWAPEGPYPQAAFAERAGLFASGSVTDLPFQAAAMRQAGSADLWQVIPFPSPAGAPAINVYGPAYVGLGSSPEQELAAWLFMRWMLAPAQQAVQIEANGSLPLDSATLEHLAAYRQANPQWAAAVDLLPSARPEPGLPSWALVRWALGDASTQLFRSYFTADQIPNLLAYLDQTAADLAGMSAPALAETPPGDFPATTPTLTPPPSQTPTPTLTPRSPASPTP